MKFRTSALVTAVDTPPISEATGWLSPGVDPDHVINLCQAVPSYPPADSLVEEVRRAAGEPDVGVYTDDLGLPTLRERFARHMSEAYGAPVRPDETAITAGCNQAFCVTILALAGRGDNVIMTTPWYFNHEMWLRMIGIEVRSFPAISEASPFPDPTAAAALIDADTRAIVLCTPNNPTGAVYPPEVIDAFYDLCAERGIALLLDETYVDFRDTDDPPHGLFQRDGWQDTLVHLYSFSKVFALTGYRVGTITAGAGLLGEVEKVMDCVAICAPHIGQRAALFGLDHLDEWKREKAALMAGRATALRDAFAAHDTGYRLVSVGAYFAYVQHPFAGASSRDVARHLGAQHALLSLPGSVFGPGQDGYLRVAFANVAADRMDAVASRFRASTDTFQRA